jgi:DNA replication and repair protein RecF
MVRDLLLRDFRCFEELVFEPSPGLNLIIGPNAQGKTSLLEAACALLRLQSPRSASLADAVRFGQPGFGLDGHWNGRHLHVRYAGGLKGFALDSKPQSSSTDYLAIARVSWISNDDTRLVRGPGAHRRRFLDFLGSQIVPGYLQRLRAYERALRSRNTLLKENRPRREIEAFDVPLTNAGETLLSARTELCRALEPSVAEALGLISGNSETLEISYQPGSPANFPAALRESRSEESRARTTVIGPHRDDIAILLNGYPAGAFASEGQQRSIALAMRLGQAHNLWNSTGLFPLYLIDDVFGELDPRRRSNLLAALPAPAQKLVTATALSSLGPVPDASCHFLGDGKLVRKT